MFDIVKVKAVLVFATSTLVTLKMPLVRTQAIEGLRVLEHVAFA